MSSTAAAGVPTIRCNPSMNNKMSPCAETGLNRGAKKLRRGATVVA